MKYYAHAKWDNQTFKFDASNCDVNNKFYRVARIEYMPNWINLLVLHDSVDTANSKWL